MTNLHARLLSVCVVLTAVSAFAGVSRGPYLQSVDTDSAVVGFRLDDSCEGAVRFGPGVELTQTAAATRDGATHFATLSGLQPGTTYSYVVEACGTSTGKSGTFRTAPVPGSREVHFAAMGDFGTGGSPQVANAHAIVAAQPEFWLALGDNAYDSGTDAEFQQRFFDPMASLLANVPLFPVLGNHEYVTDKGQPYLDNFILPTNNPAGTERYYSVDWGNVHIVALDSSCIAGWPTTNCTTNEQKAWLQADLAASKADWKIVMFHHPTHSSGEHGSTAVMQEFLPLFEAGGVDLVLTGHDHNYERTKPQKGGVSVPEGTPGAITYVVVGTGGASPRPFTEAQPEWSAVRNDGVLGYLDVKIVGGTLTAKLLTTDGQVADQFTLTKPLPPPTVAIVADPLSGQAPVTANFTANATPADAEIAWDFGDGQTGTGKTIAHTFAEPGTYTVTATATSGGTTGQQTAMVTVGAPGEPPPPPVAQPSQPPTPAHPQGPDSQPPEVVHPTDEPLAPIEGETSGCAGSAAGNLVPLAAIAALTAGALFRRRRSAQVPVAATRRRR